MKPNILLPMVFSILFLIPMTVFSTEVEDAFNDLVAEHNPYVKFNIPNSRPPDYMEKTTASQRMEEYERYRINSAAWNESEKAKKPKKEKIKNLSPAQKEGLAALIYDYLKNPDNEIRSKGLQALKELEDLECEFIMSSAPQDYAGSIVSMLDDPNENTRATALRSIMFLRAKGVSIHDALVKALQDPSPAIREQAIRSSEQEQRLNASNQDDPLISALGNALLDPEPNVRDAAKKFFNIWSAKKSLLNRLLESPDPAICTRALNQFSTTVAPDSTTVKNIDSVLKKDFGLETSGVQSAAVVTLKRAGTEEARDILKRFVRANAFNWSVKGLTRMNTYKYALGIIFHHLIMGIALAYIFKVDMVDFSRVSLICGLGTSVAMFLAFVPFVYFLDNFERLFLFEITMLLGFGAGGILFNKPAIFTFTISAGVCLAHTILVLALSFIGLAVALSGLKMH